MDRDWGLAVEEQTGPAWGLDQNLNQKLLIIIDMQREDQAVALPSRALFYSTPLNANAPGRFLRGWIEDGLRARLPLLPSTDSPNALLVRPSIRPFLHPQAFYSDRL